MADIHYSETDLSAIHAAIDVLHGYRIAQTQACGCACHCLNCQALEALQRVVNAHYTNREEPILFQGVAPSPLTVLDEHHRYHMERARAASDPAERDVLLRISERLRMARDAALLPGTEE